MTSYPSTDHLLMHFQGAFVDVSISDHETVKLLQYSGLYLRQLDCEKCLWTLFLETLLDLVMSEEISSAIVAGIILALAKHLAARFPFGRFLPVVTPDPDSWCLIERISVILIASFIRSNDERLIWYGTTDITEVCSHLEFAGEYCLARRGTSYYH